MAQSSALTDSAAPAAEYDATVLVVRYSALGDVAMTIPVLYSACLCYPTTRFVMVTRRQMTGIFVNAPANLTVVGVDTQAEYAGLGGMYRLMGRLRAEHSPSALIDLHDVLRTQTMCLLARLAGMKVASINKGRSRKRALTRRYAKVMLPLISSRARYREAFYKAGYPIDLKFDGLYGDGKAPDRDYADITAPKPRGVKWVGIAPFAAHEGKIYPADKMERVIEMVAARGDCRIFIFGGGGHERETAERWEAKYPGAVTSLAGKRYGFKAELALLSHIDAIVTMDSANMHLAALTRTPTVSVWGATHFYCGFKGWHQSESDMVQLPLPCRPCSVFGNKKCYRGDWLCLTGIRPEAVYEKIAAKL